MRRLLIGWFVVWFGTGLGGPLRAGEADDVLAKARKTQFGGADMSRADAVLTIKGTLVMGGERFPFVGEFVVRGGARDRLTLSLEYGRRTVPFTLHGKWGEVTQHSQDIQGVARGHYVGTVGMLNTIRETALAPLLHGVPDNQTVHKNVIGKRLVIGFTMRPPGAVPFARYYFDAETGVLLAATQVELEGQLDRTGELMFSGHTETTIGAADVRVLTQAGLKPEGAAIAEYLRKRSLERPTEQKIKALIVKLGDDKFTVREQASKELTEIGRLAIPALKMALKAKDAEVARRARAALEEIGEGKANATDLAAVRVLTRLKAVNATEVLLNYLIGADEESAVEVRAALAALARRDGKTDAFLEKALTDEDARKRAVAEAVLGKDGGAYLKKPGRRLYLGPCRFPTKATILVDDQTLAEIEFVDVQFFNRLEDRVFEKP